MWITTRKSGFAMTMTHDLFARPHGMRGGPLLRCLPIRLRHGGIALILAGLGGCAGAIADDHEQQLAAATPLLVADIQSDELPEAHTGAGGSSTRTRPIRSYWAVP
jgi:hypothetical protein